MSCTGIKYPTQRLSGNNSRVRVLPLPINEREIATMTLTLGAAIAVDDEQLTLGTGLTKEVWAGDILTFNAGTTNEQITVADNAGIGDTIIPIVPAEVAVANGSTAETAGLCYVTGITSIQIASNPTTEQSVDVLSGGETETLVTGSSYTLPLVMDIINNCHGQGLFKDLLYDRKYREREVFLDLIFDNGAGGIGDRYLGAAVLTAGTQDANPNAKRTMNVTATFNGCSFKFIHSVGFDPISWPSL